MKYPTFRSLRILAVILCIFSLSVSAVAQSATQTKPQYQMGTVLQVNEHQPSDENATSKQYDVSIRVGSTEYIVLYEPRAGTDVVQYKVGLSGPVLIDGDKLKVSDLLGNTITLPILSSKHVVSKKTTRNAAGQ